MWTMSLKVAPFAGAWIEIFMALPGRVAVEVAPFAGAWIEIVAGMNGSRLS